MSDGNRYIVSEDTLKRLILCTMKYEILEGDHVSKWQGYMLGLKDYITEYFPELDDEELDLEDCVELELKNYPLL